MLIILLASIVKLAKQHRPEKKNAQVAKLVFINLKKVKERVNLAKQVRGVIRLKVRLLQIARNVDKGSIRQLQVLPKFHRAIPAHPDQRVNYLVQIAVTHVHRVKEEPRLNLVLLLASIVKLVNIKIILEAPRVFHANQVLIKIK